MNETLPAKPTPENRQAASMTLPLDDSNPEHRGLKRLLLAQHDMKETLNVLNYIKENINSQDDFLYMPLVTAAVITYSRPFQPTAHYQGIPQRYERFKNANLKKNHESILEYRNAFIAHSEQESHPVSIMPPGSILKVQPPDGGSDSKKTEQYTIVSGNHISRNVLNLSGVNAFIELVKFQLARLNTGIEKARNRIVPLTMKSLCRATTDSDSGDEISSRMAPKTRARGQAKGLGRRNIGVGVGLEKPLKARLSKASNLATS